MNIGDILLVSQKGKAEVLDRQYKLGMKKRSLLILLINPLSVEVLLQKSVLPQAELYATLNDLLKDGFIVINSKGAPIQNRGHSEPSASISIYISDEVIISEAKFLLSNFVVEHLDVIKEETVKEVKNCRDIASVRLILDSIYTQVTRNRPKLLESLQAVVDEINMSA